MIIFMLQWNIQLCVWHKRIHSTESPDSGAGIISEPRLIS